MRTNPARAVLLLALGLPCLASAAEPPRIRSLWPLFYSSREEDRADLELLGPLVFHHRRPEGTTFGLRPFFSVQREAEPRRSTWHVLYPLSFFRFGAEATLQYVFPLYYRYRRPSPRGAPVGARAIFPFFWWGTHPTGGSWFFIFPLGGTAKGLLGQDSILFAANAYVQFREGDYVSHHVLWPFFSISRGPGRRAIRIWPFYGRAEREGQWWNGYVLWPFLTYGRREAAKGKGAADFFYLFPFFGRARSRDGESGSYQVLWPFFYYGWNKRNGYREWDMPFPIVMGKRTETVQTTNLWPLWGRRRYKAGSDHYYLWPFVHTSRVRGRDTRRDEVRVFPFFTRVSSASARGASRRSFWLFWPLWRSRSEQAGEARWGDANSLQFAWFKWPVGFDRAFNALLGLFEHERSREGRQSTAVLWRLLRWERGPGWRSVQLGPLASWSRSAGLTRASFLLGLVETGTREGRRGWRVFFVPFGASLAGRGHSLPEEGARGGR